MSSVSPPLVRAEQKILDVLLRVTVQQRVKGQLNPALHFQELACWNGQCSLTTVTLNICRPSPVSAGRASPVVVERSSTTDGSLSVTREANTLIVVETGSDTGGRYTITQRFRYETPSGTVATRLLAYSGATVKDSVVAQQVLSIEFVPLRGTFKEMRLDCPLGLPGVE